MKMVKYLVLFFAAVCFAAQPQVANASTITDFIVDHPLLNLKKKMIPTLFPQFEDPLKRLEREKQEKKEAVEKKAQIEAKARAEEEKKQAEAEAKAKAEAEVKRQEEAARIAAEEAAKAEDLGNYYRIPADNRDLNYDKYFDKGDKRTPSIDEYNSHNTAQLDVSGTIEKLLTVEYVTDELESNNK